MKIIAIDPGASGGIAWQDEHGNCHCVPAPKTEGDVLHTLRDIGFVDCRAIVEQVGGFIRGNPAPGSAMFNFGRGFGFYLGVLMAYDVRVELVMPNKWQKGLCFSPRDKEESKNAFKNRLKEKAQQLYPGLSVTLKTCDSLLLLEYARKHPIQ
jgi:hypothetical protein